MSLSQVPTINGGVLAIKPIDFGSGVETEMDLFEITGNQTVLIQDASLTINGPLFIRDNATLKIVNSSIYLGETRDGQNAYFVEVMDSGGLEVFNSTIYGNPAEGRWITLRGRSRAVLLEVGLVEMEDTKYPGQTFPRLLAFDDASLYVDSCSLWFLWVSDNVTSTIKGSRINSLGPYSSLPVLVYNSTIETMRLTFKSQEITLTGNFQGFHRYLNSADLLPGHPREFNFILHDTMLNSLIFLVWGRPQKAIDVMDAEVAEIWIDGPANVTVKGSKLGRLQMSEHGSLYLDVYGSAICSLSAWMENIDAHFQNSKLGRVSIDAYYKQRIGFKNCTVENYAHLWVGGDTYFEDTILGNLTILNPITTPLTFKNCSIEGDIVSTRKYGSKVALEGSLRFGRSSSVTVPHEGYLEVTRTYTIKVRRDGLAVEGTSLELRKGETSIWKGVTGECGDAIFVLSYKFSGAGAGSYPVLLYLNGDEAAEVDLFTETPIIINLSGERFPKLVVWIPFSIILIALFGLLFFILRKIGWF